MNGVLFSSQRRIDCISVKDVNDWMTELLELSYSMHVLNDHTAMWWGAIRNYRVYPVTFRGLDDLLGATW